MNKPKRTVLNFLSKLSNDLEDKLLYSFFIISIAIFVIIRFIEIFLFIQLKNDDCATTVCPDMYKKSFSQLPLTIKIMETIRPIGGTLSLLIIEIIIILINEKLKKITRHLTYIGVSLASCKILTSIIEASSNIDAGKYIVTDGIKGLNHLISFFVLFESVMLYCAIISAYYRYRLQINDYLLEQKVDQEILSKKESKYNTKK